MALILKLGLDRLLNFNYSFKCKMSRCLCGTVFERLNESTGSATINDTVCARNQQEEKTFKITNKR